MSGSPQYQNTIKQLFKLARPEDCVHTATITSSLIKKHYPKFRSSCRSDWYDVAIDCIGILRPSLTHGISEVSDIPDIPDISEVSEVSEIPTVEIDGIFACLEFMRYKAIDINPQDLPENRDIFDEFNDVIVRMIDEDTSVEYCHALEDAFKRPLNHKNLICFEKGIGNERAAALLELTHHFTVDLITAKASIDYLEENKIVNGYRINKLRFQPLREPEDFYQNLRNIYFDEYHENNYINSKIFNTKILFQVTVEDVLLKFMWKCKESKLYFQNPETKEIEYFGNSLLNFATTSENSLYTWLASDHPIAKQIQINCEINKKKRLDEYEKEREAYLSAQNLERKLAA